MADDGTAMPEKVVGKHLDYLCSYMQMDPKANRQACDLQSKMH